MLTLHRYLYWSVLGTGGGIFRLDLTLAKSGNCFSSASSGAVNIVGDFAANGINSMTLNLEDSLLYFAYGGSNLASISLGDASLVIYNHTGAILDARSIASYNQYLAVTTARDFSVVLGLFVKIRLQQAGRELVGIRGSNAGHLYMIRDEFQPSPGMHTLVCLPCYIIDTITQYHLDL